MAGAATSVMAAAPALAQTTDIAVADDDMERMQVTGSRIAREDLTGSAPLTIVDAQAISRSGVTSLGELIQELPSFAGQAQTTQVNNGGNGGRTISLRGLGSNRTLVLLNGRRLPGSFSGVTASVDLNAIPVAAVDRIEILKEGASTAYGADAVAGVVNIITKRDFDGVELSVQYGESFEGDAESDNVSFSFGKTAEKFSFFFNATRFNEDEIEAADREFSQEPLAFFLGDVIFLGSSAPPWGNYNPGGTGQVTLGPDFEDEFRPFDFFGGDSYNFAPANFQRQPIEGFNIYFQGDYDLSEELSFTGMSEFRIFGEVLYSETDGQQKLAETPLAPLAFFGINAPYAADNFYNPFGVEIGDWRRRMVESGSRTDDNELDQIRVVLGANGGWNEGLLKGWDWDAFYLYSEVKRSSRFGPIFNLDRVANAVGPTTGSLETGDLQCVNDSENCVPLNVFGENSVTQEMLDYIAFTTNEDFGAEVEQWELNVSTPELFALPYGDLGVAFGYSHRDVSGFDIPDSQVVTLGDRSTGTPRQPTGGGFVVNELYAEIFLPLLADLPFAKQLDVEFGVRHSRYDTFGNTTNIKIGGKYRPFEDLLLRASYSEAFREPTIFDSFGGAGTSFPSLSDPCAENPTQFCIEDGVPAGGFEPVSTQIRERTGGNPNVEPEEAETFTAGAVYTPTFNDWVQGFAIGFDYFDIELTNAIDTVGTSFILTQCAENGSTCNLIDRFGPEAGNSEGFPSLVDNTTTNVGGIDVRGVDIFVSYTGLDTPFGVFNFSVDGAYLDQYDKIQADGSVIAHAGRFIDDQDGYFARWRVLGTTTWSYDLGIGQLGASWDVRWISEADENFQDQGTGEVLERTVDGRIYNDIQVSFDFEAGPSSNILVFGIDNLFDKEPPFSLDAFNDNTDVRTFDTVGRFWYGRITTRF